MTGVSARPVRPRLPTRVLSPRLAQPAARLSSTTTRTHHRVRLGPARSHRSSIHPPRVPGNASHRLRISRRPLRSPTLPRKHSSTLTSPSPPLSSTRRRRPYCASPAVAASHAGLLRPPQHRRPFEASRPSPPIQGGPPCPRQGEQGAPLDPCLAARTPGAFDGRRRCRLIASSSRCCAFAWLATASAEQPATVRSQAQCWSSLIHSAADTSSRSKPTIDLDLDRPRRH